MKALEKHVKVVAECVIDRYKASELLGVDPNTHWFRVVHELSEECTPWAIARLQACER